MVVLPIYQCMFQMQMPVQVMEMLVHKMCALVVHVHILQLTVTMEILAQLIHALVEHVLILH